MPTKTQETQKDTQAEEARLLLQVVTDLAKVAAVWALAWDKPKPKS